MDIAPQPTLKIHKEIINIFFKELLQLHTGFDFKFSKIQKHEFRKKCRSAPIDIHPFNFFLEVSKTDASKRRFKCPFPFYLFSSIMSPSANPLNMINIVE